MLQFAWPWSICAIIAPLLVALSWSPAAPWGGVLRVPFLAAVRGWTNTATSRPRWQGNGLAVLAWAALVCAACRPQWVSEPQGIAVSGRNLLVALDISASMRSAHLGSEMAMSVVRRVAGEFIAGRHGDRVALILFGSRPYLLAPLTFDRVAVGKMLREATVGLAGDGTAIGDAIGLGIRTSRALEGPHRVLVLLTDGANTSGMMDPLEAARMARANALRIYTIGVGPRGQSATESTLDEQTLETVAARTGGQYFRAEDPASLAAIYARLDDLEPTAGGQLRLRPTVDVFHWPLAAAFATAALAGALRLRRQP